MNTLLMTKEKLSRIKEKVLLKSKASWLKEHYLSNTFENPDLKYAYCIYIQLENENRLISSFLFDTKPNRIDLNFIGNRHFVPYLKEYNPKDFEGLLFLIDAYPINIKSLRQDFYYDPSPLFQVMEYFLMPSQGIILWHYQLENILKLFFHPSEVTFLRKGLGAHKPEVLDKMESISLNPSLTLADFLSNRMYVFRRYTKSPNVKVAYDLFRWLSS